jgi:hypothetical protein
MKTEQKVFQRPQTPLSNDLIKLSILQITSTTVHICTFLPRTTSPDPESETADDDRFFQALSLGPWQSVTLLALLYTINCITRSHRTGIHISV